MELENFQDINDYPKYMINEEGDIYSKKYKKILKQSLGSNGYYRVKLRKDIKSYSKTIHRLLGLQYLPNPDNKPCIDHINRNKIDNTLTNLRWATYNENCKNLSTRKNTTSKFVGVRKVKNKIIKPYRAETTFQKKKYHVGYFETEEEGHEAYKQFNKEHFNIDIFD